MHTSLSFLSFLSLLSPTLSTPLPFTSNSTTPQPQDQDNTSITTLTTSLLTIAPTSSSCTSAPIPSECATASVAAPAILSSFNTYNIHSPSTRAALLALMAYETAEFKYNRNHFPSPGVPGQGTRNLQSPHFNLLYAQSIPQVVEIVEAEGLQGDVQGVVDLLTGNPEWDFGSAAWFLRSQCEEEVERGLARGTVEGWEGYLRECVGVGNDEGRERY